MGYPSWYEIATRTHITDAPNGVFFPVLTVADGERYEVRFMFRDDHGHLTWSGWREFTLPREFADGDALVSRLCCGYFSVIHTPEKAASELVRESAPGMVSSDHNGFVHAQYRFNRKLEIDDAK